MFNENNSALPCYADSVGRMMASSGQFEYTI